MVSIRATQLHTQLLLTKPYLKAHYLEEFLAANLSNEYGNTDKVTNLLEDCRKLNVKVLPPDINNPTVKFGVKKKKIIFGMSAIKNVGVNAVEAIKTSHQNLGRNFKIFMISVLMLIHVW